MLNDYGLHVHNELHMLGQRHNACSRIVLWPDTHTTIVSIRAYEHVSEKNPP